MNDSKVGIVSCTTCFFLSFFSFFLLRKCRGWDGDVGSYVVASARDGPLANSRAVSDRNELEIKILITSTKKSISYPEDSASFEDV